MRKPVVTLSLMLTVAALGFALALAGGGSTSIETRSNFGRAEAETTHLVPSHLASAASVRYRIDASQSRFIVQAFRSGLLKAFGHDHTIQIKDFSGEALIAPDTLTPASLQLTIKADSLAVIDKVSESDRREIEQTMRQQVLETSSYPTIAFKSTQTASEKNGDGSHTVKIWGDITLHGVTGGGYIVSQVRLSGNNLQATGNFSIRQTDYKIKPVSVAGGTIKVKDEIRFTFDIAATRE
jgi:polyisoprenoid-binding protein YceI